MKFRNILLLFFCSLLSFAQTVKVSSTEKIQINNREAFFPKFSIDDSEILFTQSNFAGLYKYNLFTKEIITITDELGTGYNPLVVDEENVVYRTTKIINGKKYKSAVLYNTDSKSTIVLEKDKRELKIPTQLIGNSITLYENRKPISIIGERYKLSKSSNASKAIVVENNDLILIENNTQTILNPLGKGVYVWESISKNGDKVLFTFGNKGSYLCNTDGDILLHIEKAHYPRLSPGGKFISYMIDKDNGYEYTQSDIYVYVIATGQSYKITNTPNVIEMYPEWSHDGTNLVYHTTDGELYISSLIFE